MGYKHYILFIFKYLQSMGIYISQIMWQREDKDLGIRFFLASEAQSPLVIYVISIYCQLFSHWDYKMEPHNSAFNSSSEIEFRSSFFKCHLFGFLSNASSSLTEAILLHFIDVHYIFSPCGWLSDEVYFFYLFLDSFGKTDDHEPLQNAVRSDSAVIGGNLTSFLKAGKISMTLSFL